MISEKESIKEDRKEVESIFNRKVIIQGSLWFALFTVAAIAGVFFFTHTGSTVKALTHISYGYIFLCFGMLFIDLMLGSWRNHIYIRKLAPGVSQWVSFRANVANMFMGAVTPAHSGAGPAQLYVYTSHGVKFIDAFAVALINLGATLIFMPLAGFAALLLMDQHEVSGMVPAMLKYGFGFFFLSGFAFLLAFWKPVWVGIIIKKVAAALSRILPQKKKRLAVWAENTYTKISLYQQTCRVILKQYPLLFPLSLLLTAVLYFNKYCLQYVILLGLGVPASLVQVISIQVLIQFMIYFAPSPGGSGFAEVSISVLFGKFVPAALLPVFTLLQRSFLLFFPALIGAYVVINLLRRQTQNYRRVVS